MNVVSGGKRDTADVITLKVLTGRWPCITKMGSMWSQVSFEGGPWRSQNQSKEDVVTELERQSWGEVRRGPWGKSYTCPLGPGTGRTPDAILEPLEAALPAWLLLDLGSPAQPESTCVLFRAATFVTAAVGSPVGPALNDEKTSSKIYGSLNYFLFLFLLKNRIIWQQLEWPTSVVQWLGVAGPF